MNLEGFMMNKIRKTDCLFAFVLLINLLIHIYLVFAEPFLMDESFYTVIPLRLLNGDSLVQHEWNLTQFSSLFAYLPVCIWTAIKGSADGILVFMRFTYLFIHTAISIAIYAFFRKYEKWAIMASMMFYTQATYKTFAISYHSVFVIGMLLLVFCLIKIYEQGSTREYIIAGVCFACCCICNPIFCAAFLLYLIACVLWINRVKIKGKILKVKASRNNEREKRLTKKQKKEIKQQMQESLSNGKEYSCFFSKEAALQFTCGILIVIVIAIAFFFITGGEIESISDNIGNLFNSTEYYVASKSLISKLIETVINFSEMSMGTTWFLPLLFLFILSDKKRMQQSRRWMYLLASVLWMVAYDIGGWLSGSHEGLTAFSLPFWVFSTVCNILTENKNKVIFRCFYIPCMIATLFQYLAANTYIAVIGVVLAVSNVAGVFFIMDLWKEMTGTVNKESETTEITEKATVKGNGKGFRNIIIVGFCIQIMINIVFNMEARIYTKDDNKITTGPYAGIYMNDEKYTLYNNRIRDLDTIKELSREDDPILLATYNNWMYLYLDRPCATYTAWYRGTVDQDLLTRYYEENPEKIPEYIYIDSPEPENVKVDMVSGMFDFTRENLSNGVLLTVTDCKIK